MPVIWQKPKSPKEVLRENLPFYANPYKLAETYQGKYSPDVWDYIDLTDLVPAGKVGALGAKLGAPAIAIAINPTTAVKLYQKILDIKEELKKAGKELKFPGYRQANFERANLALAYLAGKYPRLFSKIKDVKFLDRADPGVVGGFKQGSGVLGEPEIVLNPSWAANPATPLRDIISTLAHEMSHMADEMRLSPRISYIAPPEVSRGSPYLLHPTEIIARRTETDVAKSKELYDRYINYWLGRTADYRSIRESADLTKEWRKGKAISSREGTYDYLWEPESASLQLFRKLQEKLAERVPELRSRHLIFREAVNPELWGMVVPHYGRSKTLLSMGTNDRELMNEAVSYVNMVENEILNSLADRIARSGMMTREQLARELMGR